MTERSPRETVEAFIETFIRAWQTGDADTVGEFFADDAEYCNGPLESVKGRDAIVAAIASFMAMGGEVDVEIAHLLTDGPLVMTERVDRFTKDGVAASMPMMGIFEVYDGVITAWRDYFDLNSFMSQLAEL